MRVKGEIIELEWKPYILGWTVTVFNGWLTYDCEQCSKGYKVYLCRTKRGTFKTLKEAKVFAQDHFNNLIKGVVHDDNGS